MNIPECAYSIKDFLPNQCISCVAGQLAAATAAEGGNTSMAIGATASEAADAYNRLDEDTLSMLDIPDGETAQIAEIASMTEATESLARNQEAIWSQLEQCSGHDTSRTRLIGNRACGLSPRRQLLLRFHTRALQMALHRWGRHHPEPSRPNPLTQPL